VGGGGGKGEKKGLGFTLHRRDHPTQDTKPWLCAFCLGGVLEHPKPSAQQQKTGN